MKKLQSIVAGLLAVALLTCSASAMDFPDVDSDSPYLTAIQYVSEIGIMVGDSNGNFNPNQIVSRCEMATIVCRVLGQTENLSKSNVFADVPMEHWANAYIAKASQLGIVGGYGGGKFGPGDPVTYEQATTMIIRAIGKEETALTYGGYPLGHLRVAEENGLLKGIQTEQGQGLSRGAVAMLLYNYYTTQNNSGTSSDVGEHTHNYIEKAVPDSGHYEQVLVRYDYEPVYEEYTEYECSRCGSRFNTGDAFREHTGVVSGHFDTSKPCFSSSYLIYHGTKKVSEKEIPVYENKWVEDTIRVCSICGQQEPEAHTHNYVTKSVPGTDGHYEQVQTGTKWVEDYTTVIEYECKSCHWKTTDRDAFYTHNGTLGSFFSASCPGSGYYTTEKKVSNGGHDEPIYENKWIEDSSTTIRVCSICGEQEP